MITFCLSATLPLSNNTTTYSPGGRPEMLISYSRLNLFTGTCLMACLLVLFVMVLHGILRF